MKTFVLFDVRLIRITITVAPNVSTRVPKATEQANVNRANALKDASAMPVTCGMVSVVLKSQTVDVSMAT